MTVKKLIQWWTLQGGPLDPTSSAMHSAWYPWPIFNWWACSIMVSKEMISSKSQGTLHCSDHIISGRRFIGVICWGNGVLYLTWKVRCHWKTWRQRVMDEGGAMLQQIIMLSSIPWETWTILARGVASETLLVRPLKPHPQKKLWRHNHTH